MPFQTAQVFCIVCKRMFAFCVNAGIASYSLLRQCWLKFGFVIHRFLKIIFALLCNIYSVCNFGYCPREHVLQKQERHQFCKVKANLQAGCFSAVNKTPGGVLGSLWKLCEGCKKLMTVDSNNIAAVQKVHTER